jgi:GYF domain 2
MKKYYLHNGTSQQGPFDLEELKAMKVTSETLIWFEGLPDWSSADKIEELKPLLNTSVPPPFKNHAASPSVPLQDSQKKSPKSTHETDRKIGLILRSIGAIGGIALIIAFIVGLLNNGSDLKSTDPLSYKEKVMSVGEIELSQPTKFLTAEGNYNENFWGDKIKVHGIINNKATVAAYKDALVRITYYSKTKTVLGSKDYTIYEIFPPHSQVKFELKIDNYKDVSKIGWDVIDAKAK